MQQDISLKMKDLAERDYKRLMIYMGSETFSQYSVFWRTFITPRIEKTLYGSQEFHEQKHVRRTVDAYATNVRMTGGLCRHMNIRCHFFLKPLVITKSPLTPLEQAAIDSLDKDLIDFVREFYRRPARMLRPEGRDEWQPVAKRSNFPLGLQKPRLEGRGSLRACGGNTEGGKWVS